MLTIPHWRMRIFFVIYTLNIKNHITANWQYCIILHLIYSQIQSYILSAKQHHMTDVRDSRISSGFSLKVPFQMKATLWFCHWNSASTLPQHLSDLVRCPSPRQLQPRIKLLSCATAMPVDLAASVQLLLCEWQLIKALGLHRHYVIPLQGSVLLAMKHTATRALKTQAPNLAKLALSSRGISSDMLLREKMVTLLTVCYLLYCITSPEHTTSNNECTAARDNAGSCIKYSHPNYEGPH